MFVSNCSANFLCSWSRHVELRAASLLARAPACSRRPLLNFFRLWANCRSSSGSTTAWGMGTSRKIQENAPKSAAKPLTCHHTGEGARKLLAHSLRLENQLLLPLPAHSGDPLLGDGAILLRAVDADVFAAELFGDHRRRATAEE